MALIECYSYYTELLYSQILIFLLCFIKRRKIFIKLLDMPMCDKFYHALSFRADRNRYLGFIDII